MSDSASVLSMVTCPCPNGQVEEPVIGCESCSEWFHHSCVGLTLEQMNTVKKFYCPSCENDTDHLTTWEGGKKATGAVLQDKKKNYFEVEKIVNHRTKTVDGLATRQFLIKWFGYRARTWEPESHLDGSLDLLQKYLRDKKMPLSTVEALLGSTSSITGDVRNWQPMSRVLSMIGSLRNMQSYKTTLRVKPLKSNTSTSKLNSGSNKIYLLPLMNHCYVILRVSNITYIADGQNNYINNKAHQKCVNSIMQTTLIPVRYDSQYRADQCATSAVVITLEFMRAYRNNSIPDCLVAPKAIKARITKRFHEFPCAPLDFRPSYQKLPQHKKCPHCGKTYRKNGMKALNLHILRAHGQI